MNGSKVALGVLVAMAPSDRSTAAIPPRGFQTESDGSYDFTNVPEGDYLIFTTDRMDLEYLRAETIQPYLAAANAVRVESHKVQTENLSFQAK